MIYLIGRIFSGVIGWAIPGAKPLILYASGAFLAVSLIAGYAWHKGAEGKGAAIATIKADCEMEKAVGAATHAKALSDLLFTIQQGEEASQENKTAAELCKGSRFCRDGVKR